jgi:DNA-binding MarR family transcriptional regulator
MPPNGSHVIGAIARIGSPLSAIIEQLGVSKQAAGHLVDALVSCGYLDRAPDPEDRRQLTISLTARGEGAAAVTRAGVQRVDAYLLARVGAEHVAHTQATLIALLRHGPNGAEVAASS